MDVEELLSDNQGEFQPSPLGAGDLEAVEALMSMTEHWKTRSFRHRYFRPLTPSSDCSEDDSRSVVLPDSPLVIEPYGLKVVVFNFLFKSKVERLRVLYNSLA